MSMPDVKDVTRVMSEKSAYVDGKRVKIDFADDGFVMLDGIAGRIDNTDGPADATMTEGKRNGTMAFMQGKLKVDGDMSVALKFQSVTAKMRG
jgi:putative sterol carrier protein